MKILEPKVAESGQIQQAGLLEELNAYKSLATLFTLLECGVLEHLQKEPVRNITQLAEELKLDVNGLQLMFCLMEQAGYLNKVGKEKYILSAKCNKKKVLQIIALESRLYATVFTIDQLMASLHNKPKLELALPINAGFQNTYYDAFQQVAELAAWCAFRQLKTRLNLGLHIELSRPAQHWELVLKKFRKTDSYFSYSIPFKKDKARLFPAMPEKAPISSLFLFNSIRLLYKKEKNNLEFLLSRMPKNAWLIVTDIFNNSEKPDDPLLATLAIEWWAFQQYALPTEFVLIQWLGKSKFELHYLAPLNNLFQLIIFKKQ